MAGLFAEAVIETANQATDTANRLLKMAANDRQRIGSLERVSGSMYVVHQSMLTRPLITSKWLQEKTQLAQATVNTALIELEKLKIVREITGQKRNRIYAYTEYIQILDEGTELP
jgi:Fic family protein